MCFSSSFTRRDNSARRRRSASRVWTAVSGGGLSAAWRSATGAILCVTVDHATVDETPIRKPKRMPVILKVMSRIGLPPFVGGYAQTTRPPIELLHRDGL